MFMVKTIIFGVGCADSSTSSIVGGRYESQKVCHYIKLISPRCQRECAKALELLLSISRANYASILWQLRAFGASHFLAETEWSV